MSLPDVRVTHAERATTKGRAVSWMTMALVLACSAAASQAPTASQALDRLLACRTIASSPARLACFDRESAAGAAARAATVTGPRRATGGSLAKASGPGATSAAVSGAAARHSSTLDPLQTFGLPPGQILAREEAARRAPRPLDHIAARIVALASTGDGREIFTLDNNQVWAELEPGGDLYAKPGETVEISRGLLGSYSLSLRSRRSCKVTRLR